MTRVLIWDSPTRVFHWLFAGGFTVAAVVALGLGDDSPLFPYHSIIGLTLGLMVLLRIVWGFAGSRYARFRTFAFGPRAVLSYFKHLISASPERHVGHNPGSAWVIFAMLGVMLAIAATGVSLGLGNEGIKEVHEILVYTMLALIAAHLMGIVIHTVRHHEYIAAAMIHGRKTAAQEAGIPSARSIAAVAFLVITGLWLAGLFSQYDPASGSLRIPVIGTQLQLGDSESGKLEEDRSHEDD